MNKFKDSGKLLKAFENIFVPSLYFEPMGDNEYEVSFSLDMLEYGSVFCHHIFEIILSIFKGLEIEIVDDDWDYGYHFIDDEEMMNGPLDKFDGIITIKGENAKLLADNYGVE